MFGEHPIGVPLCIAIALMLQAFVAVAAGRPGLGLLAFLGAVGMAALAAHSTVERDLW